MRGPNRHDGETRLFAVIEEIERSVQDNDGVYPLTTSGKLTMAAVLRLAGLNSSYLAKNRSGIESLKEKAIERLNRIGVLSKRSRVVFRQSLPRSNRHRSPEVIALMQAYAEAEIQHAATLSDLTVAHRKIEELEAQITELRHQPANVIPISRHRQNNPVRD